MANFLPRKNCCGCRTESAKGGRFLNKISGLASQLVAIEPCHENHYLLVNKGYKIYSCEKDPVTNGVLVDLMSFYSAIEHA